MSVGFPTAESKTTSSVIALKHAWCFAHRALVCGQFLCVYHQRHSLMLSIAVLMQMDERSFGLTDAKARSGGGGRRSGIRIRRMRMMMMMMMMTRRDAAE